MKNRIESYQGTGESGLPGFLYKDQSGMLVIRDNEALGTFDRVYENTANISGVSEVPFHERRPAISRSVDHAMREISELVNDPDVSTESETDRFAYQRNLHDVYGVIARKMMQSILGVRNAVFLPPQRGGELPMASVRVHLKDLLTSIPTENIANFELKRAHVGDRFVVGQRTSYMPEINKRKSVVILDDCIATNVSTAGALGSVYSREPNFDPRNVYVVAATAFQPAIENLSQNFGIPEKNFIVGSYVYAINEKGYLVRTPEEGFNLSKQYVSDMGEWTRELSSPSLHTISPWNQERLNLRREWERIQVGNGNTL